MEVGGFTIGQELRTSGDHDTVMPYSLYVGHNASWSSGTLYPTGNPADPQGAQEDAFVGHVFTAPEYLQMRREGHSQVVGDQDQYFDTNLAYYRKVQADLAALPLNGVSELIYGDGLQITCDSNADLIHHISVADTVFSNVNWYILLNCNFGARWIVDITGTGKVTIKGAPFPGVIERVVFNIFGTTDPLRTIEVSTGVGANILAPNCNFVSHQGVTRGLLIIGNVEHIIQANRPDCITFEKVVLSTRTAEESKVGWKRLYVITFNGIQPGDMICFGGECIKVVAIEETEEKKVIVLEEGLENPVGEAQMITGEASPTDPRTSVTPGAWTGYEASGASSFVAFTVVVAVLLAQFF
jgi:choice-of-anchor A domain-containing protein